MNLEEQKKLEDSLQKRRKEVIAQLSEYAKENPAVKGDLEVAVKDYGEDEDDNAREGADLERDFSMVRQLEQELRDIDRALEKIKTGTYGTCDHCSAVIGEKRLQAMPIASFCIGCARQKPY